jgi:F-type H+-transporting ATPase subunit delta
MPAKENLVHGYAQALFSVAEAEGALGSVEDELFSFAKALEQSTQLREALTDPALPAENKKAVVLDVLSERAHPVTLSLLGFLIESGRSRELTSIVQELATLAAERRQHALAEVRTAIPLSEERQKRLAEALAKATGKSLEIKVVVDPSVVGGVVAHVGDEVFDGSIRTKLNEAKRHLTSLSGT